MRFALLLGNLLLLGQAAAAGAPAPPSPPVAAPAGPSVAAPPTDQMPDCARLSSSGRRDVWDRTRSPHLGRYCDFLAQAEARMALEPDGADRAALAAGRLIPGQAAPLVLRARSAAARGFYPVAVTYFEQARALDPLSADAAAALLALATSLREVGDPKGARAAYQALVPRVAQLPTSDDRGRALLDAGFAALDEGPASVDEAVSLFRVAASVGAAGLRPLADAALALGLDRRGARAEAQAIAAGAVDAGALAALQAATRAGWRPSRREDTLALVARLREAREPPGAVSAWEAFLAGGGAAGPWAAHARARLADLRRGSPGRSARGGR